MLKGKELILESLMIATEAHKNQYRRDGKTLYIEHPIEIANRFYSPILQSIALLHDVLEDTNITTKNLLEKGIPIIVVKIVEILTKKEGEKYLDYILRIKGNNSYINQVATSIKIADIRHNYPTTHKSKQERYDMALHILKGV